MKKFELSLILALVIGIVSISAQLPFSAACERLRGDTLRLHIIANSDNEADQSVKLLVRDAILKESFFLASSANSKSDMLSAVEASLPLFEATAEKTLRENGFSYGASASLCETYFDERSYGELTLPAGSYDAVRIVLGDAEGKNWWCMLYPAVCLSGAMEYEALESYTDEEREITTEYEEYEIRFKIEELFQALFKKETVR